VQNDLRRRESLDAAPTQRVDESRLVRAKNEGAAPIGAEPRKTSRKIAEYIIVVKFSVVDSTARADIEKNMRTS
jgi:hypothetical protein